MSESPQFGQPQQTFRTDWSRDMPTTPEPISPKDSPRPGGSPTFRAPKIYSLSEQYTHLVESPEQFRHVLAERLARLQNTLPQLSLERLRQAKADIVFLKSVLDDEGLSIAQIRAGAVYSART